MSTSIQSAMEEFLRTGKITPKYQSIKTAEAVDLFIQSRKVKGVSARTLNLYPSYFKPFIARFPELPHNPEAIESFILSIKKDPETVWSYRKELLALYRFLAKRGLAPNPVELVEMQRPKRKVRRVLTELEMARLFQFCESFEERAILTTLIDTKVRVSELISMDRERIFPDHAVVTGKTGQREVPLKPETYALLVSLSKKGPVFRFEGHRMKRRYVWEMVRRLMRRAGFKGNKLGPHLLRHSASVQHIMHGGDLVSLKEELGHTTTKTTEIYAALAPQDVRKRHMQVDVLGRVIEQARPAAPLASKEELKGFKELGGSVTIHVSHRGKARPGGRPDHSPQSASVIAAAPEPATAAPSPGGQLGLGF